MKFPGQRKSKHYFPVSERDTLIVPNTANHTLTFNHVIGMAQVIVDIEAKVPDALIEKYELSPGQSLVIDDVKAEALYQELAERQLITDQFAGGTIGNTLHNYSVLADAKSTLLGVMSENIRIGSYGYQYLSNTSSRVDLNYLQGVDGPIGRCFTLISDNGERTFAINAGKMNYLRSDSIPEAIFKTASALVLSSYLLRCKEGEPIANAAMQSIEYAKKYHVPIVLTLGTKYMIAQNVDFWQSFIRDHITVVAMNEEEAQALTGIADPLQAADKTLDWADMVLCTAGPVGLFMAGYTEDEAKRETSRPLLPGSIAEFNQYEFSRPMRKSDCSQPVRVYSHISPYMGGPEKIKNTNGAGDAALAAILHDMAANGFHQANVPNSRKHDYSCLTYSSFSQVCKYANRVSYEVLVQHSPRLSRGLPEREDCLEESYWDR
ncbi:inosine/guanosine kinase [Vibrio quintilis]|uniref:Guanosine-inosine kinase n=1 Tax=Vibrio quintilis TaxID=1117707 RepID=A0A1M7YXC9_9VIBR|nr:inosine/guanosine kinase [Vibrio quintilis]SHO57327.1 Inosine-guanosine kinase [Vibrio quintilis]